MTSAFLRDISLNRANAAILDRWSDIDLPGAGLVAGCLFQTIWNLRSGRLPHAAIKDYDLFYFDDSDLSESAERAAGVEVNAALSDLGVTVEVANQARVHQWYPGHFGRPYPRLASSDDGIKRFLVLETCVGVRPGQCHAPFGVDGVYRGTLTPNPLTPYPELFADKVASYCARWPDLQVRLPSQGNNS